MKQIVFLFIIACFFSCINRSKLEVKNIDTDDIIKSNIEFSKRIFDFGTLSNDTNVQALFYIKNTGNTNLIIEEVSPECSCTGYELDNKIIGPNESTKLTVNFSTKGKLNGLQRKAIIVKSNTEKKYNTLFIRCNIVSK